MDNKWLGQIRHFVTALGAILAGLAFIPEEVKLFLTEEGLDLIFGLVGSVLAIVAFVKSWNAPEKKEKEGVTQP